jgi:four helix bundle protein
MASSYRELEAWQLAMALVEQVYAATAQYPADERFGLTMQTRRASVSVPSNLAEGQARPRGAFLNHLTIALGSLAELETLVLLAQRLRYLPPDSSELLALLARVEQCTRALRVSLRRTSLPRHG